MTGDPDGSLPGPSDRPLLHYRLDGDGPHVVLLHPVGLNLTFFDGLTDELQQQFTVLRVDLRGHGKSSSSNRAFTLEDYADDVVMVLRHLDFSPAAVVGFSFGGMLAQVLALGHAPDVSALVIGACASTFPDSTRQMLAERGTLAERQGMKAVVDPTMERWFSNMFRSRGADRAARDALLAMDPGCWSDAWRAISAIATADRLSAIRVPTLCLAGEADVSAPPETLRAIARSITGARLTVIPDGPHLFFIEALQPVAGIVIEFLSQCHCPSPSHPDVNA